MFTNVKGGNFRFSYKTPSNSSELHYLEFGLYLSKNDIVEVMITLIQERHNHSENCITVRVSRGTGDVEIYLTNERPGLAFFTTDLGRFWEGSLSRNLGWCWEEKDLKNQKLRSTLSTYTLSRYTHTWLSTKMLATQKTLAALFSVF